MVGVAPPLPAREPSSRAAGFTPTWLPFCPFVRPALPPEPRMSFVLWPEKAPPFTEATPSFTLPAMIELIIVAGYCIKTSALPLPAVLFVMVT